MSVHAELDDFIPDTTGKRDDDPVLYDDIDPSEPVGATRVYPVKRIRIHFKIIEFTDIDIRVGRVARHGSAAVYPASLAVPFEIVRVHVGCREYLRPVARGEVR